MRSSGPTRSFAALLFSVTLVFASLAMAEGARFFCPMKCEGEKTYPQSGQCPVCHMDLESVLSRAGGSNLLRVDLGTVPTKPTSGLPVQIRLTPRNTKDGAVIKSLEIQHEKKMHLIVVSSDLSWMEHVHPEQQASGEFQTSLKFPSGDTYVLFADIKPEKSEPQVFPVRLVVSGKPRKKAKLTVPAKYETRQGPLRIRLGGAADLKAGQPATLVMTVHEGKQNQVVSTFEPYLGASAHAIAISEDRVDFVHGHGGGEHAGAHGDAHGAHAAPSGTGLSFAMTFPKSGKYRLWLQFMHGKILRTIPFTLKVT